MTGKQDPIIQKLLVECRVEGGCLGPNGASYVDGFCCAAEAEFSGVHSDKMNWTFLPRKNSSQAEVEYKILGKKLSIQQAKKYLDLLGIDITTFELEIDDRLITLIERYMKDQPQ